MNAVRDEWLAEGVVPRCNVQGFRSFNSITRECEEGGDCVVKQQPMFFDDIQDFMQKMQMEYRGWGAGVATLHAIEKLMAPKREPVP